MLHGTEFRCVFVLYLLENQQVGLGYPHVNV